MSDNTLVRSGATPSLAFPVLIAASVCHFLNDLMQSLFTATYPIFKTNYDLTFGKIGLLTLTYQLSASILQPLIGLYTDSRPQPYSLPFGMGFSMAGLLTLAYAPNYPVLLLGGMLLGIGSSIFHPETSRLARTASGGRHGLGQSIFQVGGNLGSSLGPLFVAFVVLPGGQSRLSWFAVIALCGMAILTGLSRWYVRNGHSKPRVVFYGALAIGTLIGGPIGDRIGRKKVIWVSILGILPFSLVLPYANLLVTIILSVVIGLILASAFSAIVVYGQELMPDRIGMISGLFFGLSFGLGGVGAAVLGVIADWTSVIFVYKICAFLPLLGFLTMFLPDTRSA